MLFPLTEKVRRPISIRQTYPFVNQQSLISNYNVIMGKSVKKELWFMTPRGRKKRLDKDAKPVTISLGGRERVILNLIEVRRQSRDEHRDSPSEIVADALLQYWTTVEKMPLEQVEALLPSKPDEAKTPSKVTQFHRKENAK